MAPEIARGPLIGRAAESRRLGELVGLAGEPGGNVLLGGDAGVGKSRLIGDLVADVQEAGWRVLMGHCLDFGDSALPYLPFSEAFGRLFESEPDVVKSLVETSPALARLLPAHRVLAGADGRPEPTGREVLFHAVHGALVELGRHAPVLLVLEDLHWADPSTRELLTFLFTRQLDAPIAAVASYRTDDLHRRHPLRAPLAEWGRLAGVTRMELGPLGDPDMRRLVRLLHPEPLAEREVQYIVERSEGNPFFIEELVAAAAAADGGRLPADLADLLLVRLDRLDDESRHVVRAVSVVGRRAPHDLLVRGLGLNEAVLDRALRAAVEANVLIAAGSAGYAFRHALLAESVYQDLLPGERTQLHAAYAKALATQEVEGTAAELARHARAAHDLVTAAMASIQAGDEAMAVGGPDEAARHYDLALELLAEPDVAAAVGIDEGSFDLVDLAVRASGATAAAGNPYRAIALAEDQLRRLPDGASPLDRARLLHAVANLALYTDSKLDVLALTTEAVGLVPADPPGALRAEILAMHARANADRSRDDEALRWAGEALSLGRDLQLAHVVADAATTVAHLDEHAGNPAASERALIQAVAEARSAGEATAELRGSFSLGGLYYGQGRLQQALETYRETWKRAQELGRRWGPYGLDARAMVAIVAHDSGDWQLASDTLAFSGESPPGLGEALLIAIGLQVAAGRGERHALELLPRVRSWWQRDGLIAIISGAATVELLGQGGDVDAAEAVHDEVVANVATLWQRPVFQARIRLGALLLAHLAASAARSGLAERADLARRGGQLAAASAEVWTSGLAGGRRHGPESEAWVARLDAEHLRLRWLSGVDAPGLDELVDTWRRAVSAFELFGHVYEAARSRARLAAVLQAAGHDLDATAEISRAREAATRLGAQPLLAELDAIAPSSGPTRTTDSRRDEALTAREAEVLALVAEGRSNREIGLQLFISAKTVSVHVSNILAKCGAAGRTEAVAVARRRGLLADDSARPETRVQ